MSLSTVYSVASPKPHLTPEQRMLKPVVVSMLTKIRNATGLQFETIVVIVGAMMTLLSIGALISFYFAYKARKKCKRAQKKTRLFYAVAGHVCVIIPSLLVQVENYFCSSRFD